MSLLITTCFAPLDETLLHEALSNYEKIITVEDGTVAGGFGSAVLEFMANHGYNNEIKILAYRTDWWSMARPKNYIRNAVMRWALQEQ